MKSGRTKRVPYWLESGSEICTVCTHGYVHELVLRCVGCDRGLCSHCVVIESVTREPWCAECRAERED